MFVNQQLRHFTEDFVMNNKYIHLIHDNSGELKYINYSGFNIRDVRTTVYSPDMNAYAERFVRTIRNEAFDWFILFKYEQIRNILKKYISFYNSKRPHQGKGSVPQGYTPHKHGRIIAEPVLNGLFHHYKRKTA